MMQLRQYREDDHDEVLNLHNIALNEIGDHAGNSPWDDDLHKIEEVYIRPGGEFLVGDLLPFTVPEPVLDPAGW